MSLRPRNRALRTAQKRSLRRRPSLRDSIRTTLVFLGSRAAVGMAARVSPV